MTVGTRLERARQAFEAAEAQTGAQGKAGKPARLAGVLAAAAVILEPYPPQAGADRLGENTALRVRLAELHAEAER